MFVADFQFLDNELHEIFFKTASIENVTIYKYKNEKNYCTIITKKKVIRIINIQILQLIAKKKKKKKHTVELLNAYRSVFYL